MNDIAALLEKDHAHVWHPCSQMKEYTLYKPLVIEKARGSYLYLASGQKILDGISSWWCKSLGHNHPILKQALLKQLDCFEHVILANTTNEVIVTLSAMLAELMPSLNKAFYASDGSCAVEIAMKMSLQARMINKESKRTRFIALQNSYHGETLATLSVSDLDLYKKPYRSALFPVEFLGPIPYVHTTADPLWHNCAEYWSKLEVQLNSYAHEITAIILEPILQGAAGMKIYSQDFLRRLSIWARAHGVHLIADEIMTGIGRTGKMLACEHAGIEPDFLCLSKGLTSGWLPLSVVLTSDEIYQYFYDDYASGKAFMHSHTYTGNALAASVAIALLKTVQQTNIMQHILCLQNSMLLAMQKLSAELSCLVNVRGIGGVVAAEIDVPGFADKRLGRLLADNAVKNGVLLRPLGSTLYWCPPLNMDIVDIDLLANATKESIISTLRVL